MIGISEVERDTGLSKDTLRMWERRYGFPTPTRDRFGERLYDALQLEKLQIIKRLLDAGQRPGKLMSMTTKELQDALRAGQESNDPQTVREPPFADALDLLRAHDGAALELHLGQLLLRQGLQQFVLSTVAPLTRAVGDAWMRGNVAIYEEHLYTEQIQNVLRGAIQNLPRRNDSPRVLLTTLPQEQHGLGLLMVETLLAAEQVPCVALGTRMPLQDIAAAARAHRADIVALSFSAGFPVRAAASAIAELRGQLGASVSIWVGGSMVLRLKQVPDGVRRIAALEGVIAALQSWRSDHGGPGTHMTPGLAPG